MSATRSEDTEQLRLVDSPAGPIHYILRRKPIKNLNLSVGREGVVTLSIPLGYPVKQAENFLRDKSDWIVRNLTRMEQSRARPLPQPEGEICALLLEQALKRVYPLVEPMGVAFPQLKLRALKSQWGNCHWTRGYITLNSALAQCPAHLRDYVALHELVHFLHHDHGSGFYAVMDALMPDWRGRRKELKGYAAALM